MKVPAFVVLLMNILLQYLALVREISSCFPSHIFDRVTSQVKFRPLSFGVISSLLGDLVVRRHRSSHRQSTDEANKQTTAEATRSLVRRTKKATQRCVEGQQGKHICKTAPKPQTDM